MTHGCLLIKRWGDYATRKIMLHTYHTGMDIPRWVTEAPGFTVCYAAREIFEPEDYSRYTGEEAVRDLLACHTWDDGFDDPPTVAAMLIAVRPRCLAPVPPEFADDLAKWSGYNNPYILTLCAHGEDDRWEVTRDGQMFCDFSPYEMAVTDLLALMQGKKEPWRKSKS